jgi:hypothetical protein
VVNIKITTLNENVPMAQKSIKEVFKNYNI